MPEKAYIFNNTVLSNFAAIGELALLEKLYRGWAWTTLMVADEIRHGLDAGYQYLQAVEQQLTTINPAGWLKVLTLEKPDEQKLYMELGRSLGPGEASCLALAISRGLIFATDDLAARRLATRRGVLLTGTLGILIRLVREQHISLETANGLLAKMIDKRYRSPVRRLDDLI